MQTSYDKIKLVDPNPIHVLMHSYPLPTVTPCFKKDTRLFYIVLPFHYLALVSQYGIVVDNDDYHNIVNGHKGDHS